MRRGVEFRGERECARVEVRRDGAALEPARIDGFEPDRLPDAGHAGVETRPRGVFGGLLAERLIPRSRVVLHADDEVVFFARLDELFDLEVDRGRAAGVRPGEDAVDVEFHEVVDAAAVEEDFFARPRRRNGHLAVVPHFGDEVGEADAGKFALRTERDGDLRAEPGGLGQGALRAAAGKVEFVRPRAVQVQPVAALELRAGIFGTGNTPRKPPCFWSSDG